MIQISMGPDDLPKSPAGNPELPTKNRHFGTSKQGRKYITARGKAFRAALKKEWERCGHGELRGHWRILVVARTRTRGGKLSWDPEEAGCDSDACPTSVRDALEECGAFANDASIVDTRGISVYTGKAGLVIKLEPIEDIESWRKQWS